MRYDDVDKTVKENLISKLRERIEERDIIALNGDQIVQTYNTLLIVEQLERLTNAMERMVEINEIALKRLQES